MKRYQFKTYRQADVKRLTNAGYNGEWEIMHQVTDAAGSDPTHYIVAVDFPTLSRARSVRMQCVSETELLKFWDVPGVFKLLEGNGEDAGAIAFYPGGVDDGKSARCVCVFPSKFSFDNFSELLLEALKDTEN